MVIEFNKQLWQQYQHCREEKNRKHLTSLCAQYVSVRICVCRVLVVVITIYAEYIRGQKG